jgi:hypothetical protein
MLYHHSCCPALKGDAGDDYVELWIATHFGVLLYGASTCSGWGKRNAMYGLPSNVRPSLHLPQLPRERAVIGSGPALR